MAGWGWLPDSQGLTPVLGVLDRSRVCTQKKPPPMPRPEFPILSHHPTHHTTRHPVSPEEERDSDAAHRQRDRRNR